MLQRVLEKISGINKFKKIEIGIMISIAMCVIVLNQSVYKISEIEETAIGDSFINKEIDCDAGDFITDYYVPLGGDEEIVQDTDIEIITANTDSSSSCESIEIYDEDLKMLTQVNFKEELNPNLTSSEEFLNLINTQDEGQLKIRLNGKDHVVYFTWADNIKNEKRLIVLYNGHNKIGSVWILTFICYITIFLIFVLIVLVHMTNYRSKINLYKKTTKDVRDILNK